MKTNIQKRTLVGAIFMSFAVLLFIVSEQIAAHGWTNPVYSFASNWISDLGVPVITQVTGHAVNSPFHALMNFSFVVYGILIALAYILISPNLPKGRLVQSLAVSHGFGTIFVGVFPGYEWSLGFLHSFGALFVIFGGNIAIILLGRKLYKGKKDIYAISGIILGIIGLVATFIMFANTSFYYSGVYERFAIYPTLIWNLILGIHILFSKRIV